jgi:hemolysin activation/secretion protein
MVRVKRNLIQWEASVACVMLVAAPVSAPGAAQTLTGPGRDVIEGLTAAPAERPRGRVRVEGEIERSPCALADPAYANVKLTPSGFVFNNLGPVDPASLADITAPFTGAEQSISVICEVRDAVATRLRALGYVAAVQVPAQRIESGVVTLEVLYAKVTTIRVVGDAGNSEKVFERYLSRLANGEVFNRYEAERWLLLARDVPGYDVRMLLKPADTGVGEMIAEISLERTPFALDFSLQNLAAAQTGRWGGQFRAEAYGLTGLGDRTSLSFYATPDFDEQMIVQAGHDFLVGGSGLRLGGRFTYAWSNPDVGGAPPIEARTSIAAIDARYPLKRSQALSLGLTGGMEFVTQRVSFGGLPVSEDQLRIGYLRLDGEAVDMKGVGPDGSTGWRLTGALELRQGFDIFGASPNCVTNIVACTGPGALPPGNIIGDSTAFLARFQGRAELRLARHLVIALMPRAQISGASLTSYEQFALGNFTLGRGFDPGAQLGDNGLGMASEIAFPGQILSTSKQISAEPYAFADAGWVWNKFDPLNMGARPIGSVGGGVRMLWGDRARLDLGLAVPTNTVGLRQAGDVRFLMTLTTRLVPWGRQ